MLNNESNISPIIKLKDFKRLDISEPKKFFRLIYTFPNNDYLFESLYYSKELKYKYEIRRKRPNIDELDIILEFQLLPYNSYSLINYLFITKYEEYIDIYEFRNNNTEYILKQQIIIEQMKPSVCYNGFFMKIIKQNKKYENNNDIIDILIQPNRKIENYFRIYRTDENTNFFFYEKLLINDGDDPGFLFTDEKNNWLLSFIDKATDDKNKNTKSYILKYDLFSYKKINSIIIKDLKKFNSPYGYRQELKMYKNSFLFIHNRTIKIFSIDELKNNYFQIVNTRNILSYHCSEISHIDNSLLIAQSSNKNASKTYLRQYTLDKESLELVEIDSIELKGFVEEIYLYFNGYIIKCVNENNEVKYILLYK